VDVPVLTRWRALPPSARRLLTFCGASAALHVATLISFPPAGVSSAPYRGESRPEPLYATLAPAQAPHFAALDGSEGRQEATAAADPVGPPQDVAVDAKADARMGVPGGADLPLPDKWYTASELDMRAQPLDEVRLTYPEELQGTGIPGRVRVLLFIDERGVVRKTQITQAEPARLFDKAALQAWVDMRFSPAKKGGVAVKSQKLLELAFDP
jgi:TonB family protein